MACTLVYIAELAQNRYLQITHWTEREDDKIDTSKTVVVQTIFGIQLDVSYKTVGTEIFEIKHELMCLIFFFFLSASSEDYNILFIPRARWTQKATSTEIHECLQN